MSDRHLIVDAQLLQTSDRSRGMGLYLRSLLDNLVGKDIQMTWLINDNLGKLSNEDRHLQNQLHASSVTVKLLHKQDNELFKDSESVNVAIIDEAISTIVDEHKEVVYFIPALFSSEIHPVFPSIDTKNILLFHDLIPFLYYKNYFPDDNGSARKDYSQRFKQFYKSDIILTNSQTTADDLMVHFGVDQARIVPILGSAADRSKVKSVNPELVSNKFILMPSGDDFRKNNVLAVQAFSALKTGHKLVITSRFSDSTQRELNNISKDLIFTGSVGEGEFLWLLDNADVVFFPPEYEGLGMPLIEAVQSNAVIACSNIPVFSEISQKAFFSFDPSSATSMTRALELSVSIDKKAHIKSVKDEYGRITEKFNWKNVARSFAQSLDKSVNKLSKKKLAVFCPSPSSYSAIGKYAFEVHAELSRYFDVDYYVENGLTLFDDTRPNILNGAANYYLANEFNADAANRYDRILYHIGNSEFHTETILNSMRYPANAIIHDTKLKGIFDWMQHQRILTPDRRKLESKINQIFDVVDSEDMATIATRQKKLFTHSGYADRSMSVFNSPLQRLALPVGVPVMDPIKNNKPIVSFAGIISEDKGISIVSDLAKNRKIQLNIFGFGVIGDSPLLQGLGDTVTVSKNLTDKEFQDMLRRTSILVNYRPNYHGEASLSTLEAMRHGAVVIVRNVGWYSELPDTAVIKVETEFDVLHAIEALLSDKKRLARISNSAKEYSRERHSFKQYAEDLYENMV